MPSQRFTLYLTCHPHCPDVDRGKLKNSLEDALFQAGFLTQVAHIESMDEQLLVELHTEAPHTALGSVLRIPIKRLDVSIKEIEWGWVHAQALNKRNQEGVWADPYDEVPAQLEPEHTYRISVDLVLLLLLPLLITTVALIFGLWMLAGSLREPASGALGIICGLYFAIWGGGALYSLFLTNIRSITCDREGITLRYWLRPTRRFAWSQICGIRVKPTRGGQVCYIRPCAPSKPLLPVGFLSRGAYAMNDGEVIVKTIFRRAGLRFISGSRSGDAIYRHPREPL